MAKFYRYDTVEVKSDAKDKNGYYRDKAAIVGRSGLLTYYTADGKKRIEYRPPEQAFNADSLATLQGIPVTNTHPKGLVTEKTYSESNPVGAVLSIGKQDGQNIIADVVIYDLAECGKNRELSCGYTTETIETPGTTPEGEHYDAIQTNIVYNHLAVVKAGRAGNARLHLDAAGNQEVEGKEQGKMATVKIDKKDYEVDEAVGKYIAVIEAKKDAAEDALKKAKADSEEMMKKQKENFKAAVKARVEVEKIGSSFGIDKMDEKTDNEIKREVIKKVRPSMNLDGKTDDYVQAVFDICKDEKNEKTEAVKKDNEDSIGGLEKKDEKPELTLENIENFVF